MSKKELRSLLIETAPTQKRKRVALSKNGVVFEVDVLAPTFKQQDAFRKKATPPPIKGVAQEPDPLLLVYHVLVGCVVDIESDEPIFSEADIMRLQDEGEDSWLGELIQVASKMANPKTKAEVEEQLAAAKKSEEEKLAAIEKK